MANLDIGIDLGTSNILVYVRNRGVVLKEPTVIAYDKDSEKIVEIGEEARLMLGRTPGNLIAIRPLKHGVISDYTKAEEMIRLIETVKAEGDTIGGVITCVINGCPVGLGEPEFGKLHANLGAAMLSINAVKGFEYGEGFAGVTARGSEQNDIFVPAPSVAGDMQSTAITTVTNHSGGIQGGISNGQDIYFRVAFKPVATILQEQNTVDKEGNATTLKARGRHDPCVLPRAVPVVEAMAAMAILDAILLRNSVNL